MDAGIKQVLHNNRTLLVRNIVPCEELYMTLAQHDVFSDGMLDEIRACMTAEDKNTRMVDLLLVRGAHVISKFCDALQMSGHNFLSDTLREDLMEAEVLVVDYKDIFRRFPKLHRLLPDKEKEEFVAFLKEKIKEEAVRQTWRREVTVEKQKAIDAKQKQLEEAMRAGEILKEKDEIIKDLQATLEQSLEDTKERALQVKHLNEYIEDIKDKYKNQLGAQTSFNVANDNTLRRLAEREAETNKGLQEMRISMDDCLKTYSSQEETAVARRASSVSEYMDIMSVSPLDYAKTTLAKVIALVVSLAAIREQWMILKAEREQTLRLLNVQSDPEQASVTQSLRAKLADQENIIARIETELQEMNIELQTRKPASQVEQELESMQATVDSLNADVLLRDSQVRKLQEELRRARNHVVIANGKLAKAQEALEVATRAPSRPQSRRGQVTLARSSTPFVQVDLNVGSESSDAQGGEMDVVEDAAQIPVSVPANSRPTLRSQLRPTRTSQSGVAVSLPPLKKQKEEKQVDFRFLKDTPGNQKARPLSKSMNSLSNGFTRFGNSNANSNPSMQDPSSMLQVSHFGAGGGNATLSVGLQSPVKGRPIKQPRFGNIMQSQPSYEMKRNATFYR